MQKSVLPLIAIAMACGSVAVSLMSRPPKIGFAESAVILEQFTEAIKARKKFQDSQTGWDANLKALNDSLMSAMDRMKSGFDKATPTQKDSMRALLNTRNDDMQRYSGAIRKMAQDKEQELMSPVLKQVNGFMEIWGKQHGYDLILGANSSGSILRANQDLNLTSEILKDLNAHYKDLPDAGSTAPKATPPAEGKAP